MTEVAKFDKITNFDTFWGEYPKKTGKGTARKAYEKAEKLHGDKQDFLRIVLVAVQAQKRWRSQQKGVGVFIPEWKMPTSWLNAESWCDEVQINEREKKVTVGAQCAKCTNPVHGPKFTLCDEHEGWQTGKTLVEEMTDMYNELAKTCKTTEQWREMYRELAKTGLGGKCGKTMS